MTDESTHTAWKTMAAILIIVKKDTSLPVMFNPLYSSTNLNDLKRTSAIKVATIKIMDNFHYKWKPSHAYHKIDTFAVSKDEWDTKGALMSPWRTHRMYSGVAKRYLSGWGDVEKQKKKIKLIAVTIVELRLPEGISHSSSQSDS